MRAVGTAEEMPATFEGKMSLLEEILQCGLEKLLNEAKKRDCLKPPYGKTPYPTPLITEEEFFKSGAWKEDINENNEPTFSYSYGFNPLMFLGDVVRWAHPNSVVARLEAKKQAFLRLSSIGRHALRRMEIWGDLQAMYKARSSGMLWGPSTSAVNCSSVSVLCQPLRSGTVTVQTSFDEDFSNIVNTVTADFVMNSGSDANPNPASAANRQQGDYIRNFNPS